MKIYTVFTVLSVVCTILRTVHGVTEEEAELYCSIAGSICSDCKNILCTNYRFDTMTRTYRYGSNCGDLCDKRNGTIDGINFYNKRLTSLSSDIGKMTNLKYLGLTYNSLTTLPASLKSLKNLTIVYTTRMLFQIMSFLFCIVTCIEIAL